MTKILQPKVSVIILNWNQPEFTVNCVKSVLKQNYKDFEILLVDNGSEDNSLEIFKKEFSRNEKIKIIETGKNLGYAGGNNEGVKKANGDYVAILNNDTLVERDWLKNLVEGLESDEKIAAVSASEIREGSKINMIVEHTHSILGYPVQGRLKHLKDITLVDMFGIDGCSFIYKKNLANPPFDPEYFIYAEDTYLGWLLNIKGYQNKISDRAVVHHFHNITKKFSTRFDKASTYLGERNRIMNLFLFYESKTLIKILPLLIPHILLLNIFNLRKFPYKLKSYF